MATERSDWPKQPVWLRPAPKLGSGEILQQPRDVGAVIETGEGNSFSNNVSIVANERILIGSGC
jgi:hypothetical protein